LSIIGKKTGTAPAKEEKPATVEKSIGGAKNGEKRTISTDKASKYYPVRRALRFAQVFG
jgi:large subunit ribosomal protein L6e